MLCWFDVISIQVVTVKCSGRELKVAGLPACTDTSKPLATCAVTRTCNATCGAKHHRTYINTVKIIACLRKRKAVRGK